MARIGPARLCYFVYPLFDANIIFGRIKIRYFYLFQFDAPDNILSPKSLREGLLGFGNRKLVLAKKLV
jgi:hypothetical protein